MSGGKQGQRLESLDGIRGICAMLVMAMHSRFLTGYDPFPSAYLFVDVFFVMSGFVIAHAYEKRLAGGGYYGTYVWRRYARLFPMWFIGITLGVGFSIVFHHRDPDHLVPLAAYPFALVFLPDPRRSYLFPENTPGWSLFFELIANFAYGLAVRLLTAGVLATIVVVAGCGLGWASFHYGDLSRGAEWTGLGVGLIRVCFGFSMGLLLHKIRHRIAGKQKPGVLFLITAVVLVAIARVSPAADLRPLYDWGMVVLVLPALVALNINVASIVPRTAEAMGALSYPLYAIHFAVMTTIFSLQGYFTHWQVRWLPASEAIPALILLVATAYLLGRYVDPWAQRWAAKLAHRRPVETPGDQLA